jgi:hypothetical protein
MGSNENLPINDKPRRTSAVTWIALVVIVAFLVADFIAVLMPAIEAAKNK